MAKCDAFTPPGTYKRESRRCEKPAVPRVQIETTQGKKRRVCWCHSAEYLKKGEEIFSVRSA